MRRIIRGWRAAHYAERMARVLGGRVLSRTVSDGTMRHIVVRDGWRASDGALLVDGVRGASGYVAAVDVSDWRDGRDGRAVSDALPLADESEGGEL